jgi:hypothetical protein
MRSPKVPAAGPSGSASFWANARIFDFDRHLVGVFPVAPEANVADSLGFLALLGAQVRTKFPGFLLFHLRLLASVLIILYKLFMKPSIVRTRKKSEKRGRGRPKTGWTSIHLTLLPPQLSQLDEWCEAHDVKSRPEAVRQLMELGFSASAAAESPGTAAKRRPAKKDKP